MRRIPSGTTDQYLYFVAVDAADFTTRETGLSSFTVYRSRNGGAAAAFTTPTINETDATNMPGVYELLLDEDMTIGSGNDSEEVCIHITATGMAPVTLVYELYRPKITAGNTLGVESDGDLTKVNTLDGHTAQTGDNYARLGAPAGASVSADVAAVKSDSAAILVDTAEIGVAGAGLTALATQASVNTIDGIVDAILVDTGTTLPAQITALNDLSAAEVAAELATYDGPTNAEMAAAFTEIKGATWATTDTLEAIRDRGDAAWTTATGFSTHSAADVWSVATRVLTAGTNLNDLSAAQVNAEVDTALADYDGPTNAEMEARTILAASYATATALQTVDDELATVDSNVDAIKAKTDSLTYTVAGQVDANIQYVNDVQVTGTGASGDEWGP